MNGRILTLFALAIVGALVGCRSPEPPPYAVVQPPPSSWPWWTVTNPPPVTNRFVLPPPLLQLPEQKAAREEVEQSGISAALVQKMLKGEILALPEIQELAQKKVSDTNIVKYLRSTGVIYTLTTKQIDELRAASVSNEVVDYLLSTPQLYRESAIIYRPYYYYSPVWYPSWWDWHHHHYDFHHHDFHHDHHH